MKGLVYIYIEQNVVTPRIKVSIRQDFYSRLHADESILTFIRVKKASEWHF